MTFDCKYPPSLSAEAEVSKKKKVVLKDKKGGSSTYRGDNINSLEIVTYRVDGGLISNDKGVKKCDYALYTILSQSLRLIELKGSDLNKACDQITSTMQLLLSQDVQIARLYGRVVLTKVRTPDLQSSKVRNLKELLVKRGGDFKYQTQEMKEPID